MEKIVNEVKKHIYRSSELELLESMEDSKAYTADELKAMGFDAGELYHRGVINKGDSAGTYIKGAFLTRLDICSTDEYEMYSKLPKEWINSLDAMYFDNYVNSMASDESSRPTLDEILPLEDVLAFIDSKEETPYLADCDCRSLKQACDAPRNVCITYRTKPGSYVDRGLAKPITKEEAKAVVIRAEEEGLIHTINPGGVCSCCTDCCYLFRTAQVRNSLGVWPKVSYQVSFDQEKCIECGICVGRCKFNVFEPMLDLTKCQGCGLCTSTCPVNALKVEKVTINE